MNQLFEELIIAHKECAKRDNVSKAILLNAFENNGFEIKPAIISAICSLGGRHAPIKHTYIMLKKMLTANDDDRKNIALKHTIVPGFGCDFVKGERDPILNKLHVILNEERHEFASIENIVREATQKNIYPNIAFYTAAYAVLYSNITFCEDVLLIARIPTWIDIMKEFYYGP